jgi:hypothetical protein
VAGNIATQTKQGRQAMPMSSLCILLSMLKGNFDIVYNFQRAPFHCDWGYANILIKVLLHLSQGATRLRMLNISIAQLWCSSLIQATEP